jgi:hypothetical protein
MKKIVLAGLLLSYMLLAFGQSTKKLELEYNKYKMSCRTTGEEFKPYDEWKKNYIQITYSGGSYLIKASNNILLGVAFQIGGGTLTLLAEDKKYTQVGIGVVIAGFITEIVGFSQLRKAGISFNGDGIGLKIDF